MRAFNLSVFIMVFFLILSIFQSFSEFRGLSPSSYITQDGKAINLYSAESVSQDLQNTSSTAEASLESIRDDDSFLNIFSAILKGIRLVLHVVISTFKYLVFFAPVLIMWGVPVQIAMFIQGLIYLSYVISIFDLFRIKR